MTGSVRARYRLLIADDDSGAREVLRAIFEPYFELIEAACGEEAVDVIQSTRIDIALLDMHMPRRTGLETLRVLKQVRIEAPGILVTAGATDALRQEAVAAQAYQVLDKPVGKSVLMTTVDAALRSAYREFSGLA